MEVLNFGCPVSFVDVMYGKFGNVWMPFSFVMGNVWGHFGMRLVFVLSICVDLK